MIVTNELLDKRHRELLALGYTYRGYLNSMTEEEYKQIRAVPCDETYSTSYGEHLYINHTHRCFWNMDSGD